jgi:superfamily II DNA helicase RecQ
VLRKGTTVVVSPLIALMKDQCDKLVELGIAAVQINSTRSRGDAVSVRSAMANALPSRRQNPSQAEVQHSCSSTSSMTSTSLAPTPWSPPRKPCRRVSHS